MAEYTVIITKSAEKELDSLPVEAIVRLRKAVNGLATEPRPVNCKKLTGFQDLYRIRSGDYRVIYRIEDQILTIEVVRIGDRKDIYS